MKTCLDALGVEPKQLVPSDLLQLLSSDSEKFGLYGKVNFLPLELFDDEEFDSR